MDTPALQHYQLDADLGIYAEDIWHYKRLAITPGIRWEYLAAEVQPESTPAGRWVPARCYGRINCDKSRDWGAIKDWEPRLGVVYDLFGNHKTAIKGYVSKYDIPLVDSYLYIFNPEYELTSIFPGAIRDAPASDCVSGCASEIGAIPEGKFRTVLNRTLNPNFTANTTCNTTSAFSIN